ncbi:hypothetical protein MMC29_001340, partial [Sticta canariensis]|nr:hypothetical protein [Sticta canariensis]
LRPKFDHLPGRHRLSQRRKHDLLQRRSREERDPFPLRQRLTNHSQRSYFLLFGCRIQCAVQHDFVFRRNRFHVSNLDRVGSGLFLITSRIFIPFVQPNTKLGFSRIRQLRQGRHRCRCYSRDRTACRSGYPLPTPPPEKKHACRSPGAAPSGKSLAGVRYSRRTSWEIGPAV